MLYEPKTREMVPNDMERGEEGMGSDGEESSMVRVRLFPGRRSGRLERVTLPEN